MNYLKTLFILFFLISTSNAVPLENCKWNNSKGTPCITISKTPNTSSINSQGISKKVFTKQQIEESGATTALELINKISGIDYYQTGQKGQQAAIFMRGSESNHTLVTLNGIPINDQSTTNGLHDFGQDFIQTIQQIEVYKGSNGAIFGPDAIGGAINFVTDVDYTNSFSVSGFDYNNNSANYNTTKITENGWHLNFNGAANQSKTDSALAKGHESDGTRNYQVNLNGNKWLNNNLKLKSTFYYRDTKSDYDSSASKEDPVFADNKMYAIQTGIERKTKSSLDNLMFHYHNYDRKYYVQGKKDKYYSESLVAKAEREVEVNSKLSYGFGSEYKYDWGHYLTKTFSSHMGGHIKNIGIFINSGYKFNENQILSIHGRNDDHKETGGNKTYRINFTQILGQFKLGATHSTGLKNPSLYEFYGNTGIRNIKPETSETNEILGEYIFSENIKFSSTAYRTRMKDRIKIKSDWSGYENKIPDTTQEGLESELSLLLAEDHQLSFISHFAKSRTATGGPNSRRPDLSYGLDYLKKFNFSNYGPFNLRLSHRYIGDHIDWTGSKNEFVKSVDLVDLTINKNFLGNTVSLNITNLLNERYEKPATYSQDGRQLRLSFNRKY
ncbi:TonB-dependent receptor plug domain-containing protein [Candidatus Pelagibacter sp.]|nr:TonB-dependent receptor plug domain-containing protein [Candidatus Pelagibacter sp.]